VGHEIRTPLNVVSSGLELLTLQASSLDADLIETLQDTKSACKIAIDILNDLLTYEKLDSDILTLEKSPADVVELAQRVVSMFQIQARSSQIVMRLENKLPTEVAVSDVDSTKISQVIRNVISNALKFTPVGGRVAVTITVKDEGKRVRIDVQDSGVGMKKADRQRLFGEIVQFNPKELQNGQGSGMGLYLSRKIIDMHGGSIGVDLDWEGPGSVFYVELVLLELRGKGNTII
jgi:signal transduction histidine kinase